MSSDQFKQYLAIGWVAVEAAASDWPRTGAPKPERKRVCRALEIQARKRIEALLNGYFLTGSRKAKQRGAWGKSPKDFGFPDELEAQFRILQCERNGPYMERFLKMPHADAGAHLMYATGKDHNSEEITVPTSAHSPRTRPACEDRHNDEKANLLHDALVNAAKGLGFNRALWIERVEWEGSIREFRRHPNFSIDSSRSTRRSAKPGPRRSRQAASRWP